MDNFLLKEHNYKKKQKYEKDIIKPKEDAIRSNSNKNSNDIIIFNNKGYNKVYTYKNENYKIKEKGDKKLNEWIMKQTEPLIVFISDIIPDTNVLPHLEKIRPIIKTTPLMSIEEYRKRKKIGEEGVIYLKKLKEKYGNIILKTLWASINLQ